MRRNGLVMEDTAIRINGEKWWNLWQYEIRPTPSTGKKPDQNWTRWWWFRHKINHKTRV